MECNCWVSEADMETQFTTRRGGHALTCPVYRVSRDPVDQEKDKRQRAWGERAFRGMGYNPIGVAYSN